MNPYAVGPVIVFVTFALTVSGTILLRPITKALAAYLELLVEQKKMPSPAVDAGRIADILTAMDERLNRLEERQRFAEALFGPESSSNPRVAERRAEVLPAPRPGSDA